MRSSPHYQDPPRISAEFDPLFKPAFQAIFEILTKYHPGMQPRDIERSATIKACEFVVMHRAVMDAQAKGEL